MASRNLKPTNSCDSEGEAEWTFIDSDEGTIETRKDSVTYRKPTYSEILKGVVAEDLVEEVDSEPEFEVLASFKFRPKGESFGIGSSASKAPQNAKAQGKGSKHEVDDGDNDESPQGDDSSCSDDGIMVISSKANKASTSEAPSQHSDDDDYNKIDVTDTAASLDNETEYRDSSADKNIHDDDDDDDFVIADETESDFEEATMDDTAEPDADNDNDIDNDDDDDDKNKEGIESAEEKLTESTTNTLNASDLEEGSHDTDNDSDNSDDGLLGIHKGGICDNPGKDLDWDSLTFQLLSTLPRMNDSTTTLGDDNQNLISQDGTIDSIEDSDSENSSYAAISQDDSSSFDELSDSADVNTDFSSEPMIPSWLFKADKDIKDAVESFDDDSDYIISDIEALELEESGLIPQWFFDPSRKLEAKESIDGDFEFINSDLVELEVEEKDPVIPHWLYDPSYKVKDIAEDDDFEEPNPIIPRWFFDPNYKVPELDETYDDETDDSDSEFDWESEDDDSTTLPRWLFDKRFKPPKYEDDEEGFSWPSQLFVDIPTFIILLCLTTALGFSIGHGLTVYFSSQAINRNAKLQDMETPAKQFPSPLEDLGLTPEEIAKIDLLKLEDELEQRKEPDMLSEHLRFDLRELYKSLKEKHYRLLRNQKSTEDRLHISKTMSWYWRMKYDEEKRRKEVAAVPKNLRPKNFSDMANLARKTKLAKKWRRLYKKNNTVPGLGTAKPLNSNQQWLVKPSDAAIKQLKGVGSRYLMKAMVLSKKNDMKKFRNRWTQDFKKLKNKSCCSYPNKNVKLKKKATISSPFAWVNGTQKCKRVNRSNILGRCLIKQPPLAKTKNTKPTIEKPAKKYSRRKTSDLKFKPCFSKPKNASKLKKTSKRNKVTTSSNREGRKTRRNSAQLANRQEKVRKERIKKRELKKKALEIKNQVDELKAILQELRRERRRAEKEKAKLEASWRKLKRQRLQFEKERKEKKKNDKTKVKKVKSKLKREKTRLKTWKNVAKRAQKKAEVLHKDLKRVSATKQKLEDIKHIKKDLKLEKRKLREQQKNLKSIKQQLRKEHRNYARERWKTKKKRRELEKKSFNPTEPIKKKNLAKEKATRTNHIKAKKCKTEKPSPKRSQDQKDQKKKKQKPQKKFWENLEKSLFDWAQKVNRTIEHHRRGKAGKIWKKLRTQFDKLVAWTTGKSSKTTAPKKKKKEHQSKTKVKIKNPVFEKILAEQMKYDEEKRSRKDPEDQRKSKGPVVNKKKKKKKKERKKKDPETLLRQKQRKQRRKYQRELERLQQWALQMNEKKLEHERIYKEKEKMGKKSLKSRRNLQPGNIKEEVAERKDSFSNSRALVSVEDSNSTLMLLLQPQISTSTNYKNPKKNAKQKHKYQDKESVIRGVTSSQINHELNKKKTDTSLTLPLKDDVMKLPDDDSKGWDVTSFGDGSRGVQEPTPPSLSPTFYKDFPILRIVDEEKRKKEGSVSVADILSSGTSKGPEIAQDGDDGQRSEPWHMRRAEQRDNFRNTNPAQTLFRPIGPLKSDGTWFFHRSSDRAIQRELYEPLNRQNARDGFNHKAWRSYFHRGRRRNSMNDGKWVFERASDRAEQRSNNEPWYMRRAEGREGDREESKDSWFVERGFDRDLLHDYDEDDEDDDLMNGQYDYDDYADHSYDDYEGPWL